MLDANISEAIVLRWLDTRKDWPAELSADDLIALTEAGASDDLVGRFLDHLPTETPTMPSPPAPEGQPTMSVPAAPSQEVPEAAASPATDPVASPAPIPVQPQPELVSGPGVDTSVSLLHRRMFTSEVEDGWQDDQRPDMFVYLDGELLAWLEPRATKSPTRLSRTLAPGSHSLLVTLEAHEKRRSGWSHRTHVSPERWSFEFEPDGRAALDISFDDSQGFRHGIGPLSVRVEQNGTALLEEDLAGGDPADWPYLCDDIEAGIKDGHSPSLQARTYLRNCVDWFLAWPSTAGPRERDEILTELSGDRFRPDFQSD